MMRIARLFAGVSLAMCAVSTAYAQTVTARDSAAFTRARGLVTNGNGSAGRLIVDSIMTVAAPDTPLYGEALYWRAALAATSADAERDYKKLIVEYPLSLHTADALLQLGQLESARGDRAAAASHLQEFLLENPKHAERGRAGLLLVRDLVDQGETPRACSTLRQMLREVPESEVELRNQLDYYSPRCSAADANPASNLPTPPPAPARDSASKANAKSTEHAKDAETAPPKSSEKGRYALQIAAYTSKADANALVKKLEARHIEARVVTSTKLFRVRVGRYPTRAAATAAQKELKAKKIDAFVTDIGADDT